MPLSGNHIIQNSGIVDTNSLNHGHNSIIPPKNVDLLAKEVNDLYFYVLLFIPYF